MTRLPDPEHIVVLAQESRWADAWQAVHRAAARVGTDDRLAWAASTLADAFFRDVPDAPMTPALASALETVVLLHSGGLYRVEASRFEQAVAQLVAYHRATGDDAAALRYARFAPDAPPCAAILEADPHGDALPSEASVVQSSDASEAPMPVETKTVAHGGSDDVAVTATVSLTSVDRTRSLFRSPMEKTFFLAVRDVFPTFTPYPNVALRSVLDTDTLKPYLTSDERSLLYTGIVDCVLLDPHDDYRPRVFFELDSSHHDAPDRRANDARKDRILAHAGHRLFRLRPSRPDVRRDQWAVLLRSLTLPDVRTA